MEKIDKEIIGILKEFLIFNLDTYLRNCFNTILDKCSYVSTSNFHYQQLKYQTQLFRFMIDVSLFAPYHQVTSTRVSAPRPGVTVPGTQIYDGFTTLTFVHQVILVFRFSRND